MELELGVVDVRDLVKRAALECEAMVRFTQIKVQPLITSSIDG